MKKMRLIAILLLAGVIVLSCKGTPAPAETQTPAQQAQAAPAAGTAPVLGVSLSSRYFSPDGDGVDDSLTISLSCRSDSAVADWSFEIYEPDAPNQLFFRWNGNGNPPASLVWDGKGSSGELVQSASDYPYTFAARNVQGPAEFKGRIETDILVSRDGDLLRVQVPSIMFAANIGTLSGLTPDLSASNEFILGRIAVTLNKFRDYKVQIEGHANPTAPTPALRQREHELELIPLSEQRARTVLNYLANLGVDSSRLTSFGIGGSRTIVPYEDYANWWRNRRVEFILVK